VEELDAAGSLLLGAPVTPVNRPHADVELRPGATLLLFTDGLVEAPRQSLTQRLVRLHTAVAATPTGMGPDELCEHVLDEMQASRRRDDVAVLAVQLTQVTGAEASVVERAET
jgi:serine phosphatase RsbU (regulator of sigma subunit)